MNREPITTAATQRTWLHKLTRLNPAVSRAAGEGAARYAPHKPLLLLALLDSAEAGEITAPRLMLTPGLRLRFNALWQIVVSRWTTKPDPTLPFHHLSTQGFWRALRADGTPSEDPRSTRMIELDPGFFAALQSAPFRQLARVLLVTTWFPPAEQVGLATTLGIDVGDTSAAAVAAEARAVYRSVGRDARFRIQVVVQYHYTCALTGYTLTTDTGTTMVEAAHIAAFARSRNNDPQNGLPRELPHRRGPQRSNTSSRRPGRLQISLKNRRRYDPAGLVTLHPGMMGYTHRHDAVANCNPDAEIIRIITLAQTDRFRITDPCKQFGISRKTAYIDG